jgi:hypothetical protein
MCAQNLGCGPTQSLLFIFHFKHPNSGVIHFEPPPDPPQSFPLPAFGHDDLGDPGFTVFIA